MSAAIRESSIPREQIFVTTKLPHVESSQSHRGHDHTADTSQAGSSGRLKKVWRMPSEITTISSVAVLFSLQPLHSPDEPKHLMHWPQTIAVDVIERLPAGASAPMKLINFAASDEMLKGPDGSFKALERPTFTRNFSIKELVLRINRRGCVADMSPASRNC